jgi:hypothetical protein
MEPTHSRRNGASGGAFPTSVLTTEDGQPYSNAEYFKGVDLKGAPVLTRGDKNVDFGFLNNPPSKVIRSFLNSRDTQHRPGVWPQHSTGEMK